ncbi:MAG: hypothetical protein H6719_21465 [Sandaracinaceae bacterium]|nr:hypothetical protein [Sandaracinaceae bacterium]
MIPGDDDDDERPWRLAFFFDKRLALLALGLVGAVALWLAWRTPEREGFGYHELGEGDGAPTVVLLHGYGAPGDDLTRVGEVIVDGLPGVRVICVEGAVSVGLGGRAWYLDERQRRGTSARMARFVESLVEDGTPLDRVVIGGFSQGAAIAGDVGARLPGLAGTALLSGDHSTREPIRGRLFVSHGRADPVLSFGAAERRLEDYRASATVTFAPFDGGHRIQPAEAELVRWLGEALGLGG